MHEAQQAVVDKAKLEEEMGDCCLPLSTFSRHLGKSGNGPAKANLKFERRFREVERIVARAASEMTGIDSM